MLRRLIQIQIAEQQMAAEYNAHVALLLAVARALQQLQPALDLQELIDKVDPPPKVFEVKSRAS
jgi:hypothetical protein